MPHKPPRLWTPEFMLICVATLWFWISVFFHAPLLPLQMEGDGFGPGSIGLVIGAGALAALAGRLLSGWAVEHWGPRPFLLAGALAWAAGSPAMAVANGLVSLLALRLLLGLGLAVFTNASLGAVAAAAPPERRGAALGWWGTANNLAAGVGLAVAA